MEKTDIKLFETGQIKKKVHFEIYDKLDREKTREKKTGRRRRYNEKYQQDLKDDILRQYFLDNKQAINDYKQTIKDYNQTINDYKQAINDYKQVIIDNKQVINDYKTTGDTSIRRFFRNLGSNTWFKYYR